MLPRPLLAALATTVCLAVGAAAQSRTGAVSGTAYDSLRGRPLVDAVVTLVGTGRITTSDSLGHFRFDSVAAGMRSFVLQHDVLDSVGFTGIPAHANVTESVTELQIALPSFATLWKAACGGVAPADSGFVFGSIRRAVDDKPVVGAFVDLRWTELKVVNGTSVVQRRWHGEARSDSTGSYTVCGVPLAEGIRIQAVTDSGASGLVDLPPRDVLRVQRRDLLIGPVATTADIPRGAIVGQLTNAAGDAFADARVLMAEAPEVRSDRIGRFLLRNVPVGTRQVEILAIGFMPVITTVDVTAGDTVLLAHTLRRVTTLDAMRVVSARERRFVDGYDERRKMGFGQAKDSTQLWGTMMATLTDFASTKVQRDQYGKTLLYFRQGIGYCAATVWVDGIEQRDQEELSFSNPEDLAAVEVFPNVYSVPMRFRSNRGVCGAIALWTKRGVR